MAVLPLWAVGRHVTACLLIPVTRNSTSGVITEVTADQASMYGYLDEVEVVQEIDHENIVPMHSIMKNNVPIEVGTTFRMTQLEVSAGQNQFARLWNTNYNYFKIVLTRGEQSWTGYGSVGNYRMMATRRGVKGTFEITPVDVRESAGAASSISVTYG